MRNSEFMPLVSIITPMYNSEKYVGKTIDSVLAQSYSNWEMIIVDDCSTDMSRSIVLDKAIAEPRIRYFRLDKNYGAPYAARNFATEQANGRYIAFLDSDDLWASDKLEKQVSFMSEKNAEISFTAYSKLYESHPEKNKIVHVPERVNYYRLLKTNYIGCLTAMYDVNKVGKLKQPGPQYHEDYIMWLKVLEKGFTAYGLNVVLASYRVHNQSISNNKLKMAGVTWNIYRRIMKLSFFRAAWYFFNYTINGLKKI